MTDTNTAVRGQAGVSFRKEGIYIDGSPVVVLCSSVFYFRIPRGLWRDRLRKVKEAGYNAIDVYFPWNYHERSPGAWDFSGERDVEAFLKTAAEEGLWVVARPGPYICSEWDGGALPAYLFPEKQMRLRDNDPLFLEAVSRWYGHIMPILKKFELGNGGSVIAMQLENELDFYDCREPDGYIAALRDMALQHAIDVPLFACAGQGDLYGASGDAADVMPTCNFYPNDADPSFEDKVIHYYNELQNREYPLCVTETNRSHFLLRRLLASGAKLLGPYLQTSGTNFGFHNATNNWGKPLAFLTSDYDFRGMITPAGEKRDEFYEAKLLGGLLRGLGDRLAKAIPVDSFIRVRTGLTACSGLRYMLELDGGGYLISLPNVDPEAGKAAFQDTRNGSAFPQYTEYTLSPKSCPLLPYDVPLQQWGVNGTLKYSTAEIAGIDAPEGRLSLALYADSDAELALELPDAFAAASEGATIRQDGAQFVICFSKGVEGAAEIAAQTGLILQITFMSRERAGRLGETTPEQQAGTVEANFSIPWRMERIAAGGRTLSDNRQELGDEAKHLEEAGIYRGIAWYGALRNREQPAPVLGLLVRDAGDVLSVYCDGAFEGTVIPGGGSAYLPFAKAGPFTELLIRAEIWGHTNFDDCAMPGLRMNSLKGLSGAVCVTKHADISSNWRLDDRTVVSWGGWMTTRLPEIGTYRKTVTASPDADSWVLQLPGVQCPVRVHINGQYAGEVLPMNPYVDVTPFTMPGAELQISLELERYYHQPSGKIVLLEGNRAVDWWVSGCEEEQLWRASEQVSGQAASCELPVALSAGDLIWLTAELPSDVEAACRHLLCEGSKAKITAFFNGHLVGRVWLSGGSVRPHMTGGAQKEIYVPEPWYEEGGNRIALLVEALEEGTQITDFVFRLARGK